MIQVLFFFFAAIAAGAAINVLAQRHVLYSALSLILMLTAVSVLFILLLADFLAVIVVVRQRCIHICQREARKLRDDLIRGQPMHLMPDHNILHADTAARNTRSSPACPWGTDDVLDETRSNICIVR